MENNCKYKIMLMNEKSYSILKYLDEGVSCEVYLVKDEKQNKNYAAKIFYSYIDKNLFEKEQSIMRELDNQFLVKYIDSGKCKLISDKKNIDLFCILSEYLPNNSLFHYISLLGEKDKGLEEYQTKLIFMDILKGIKYLHDKGIVHRDIKPENIMFGDNFIPIIIDFGFAEKINATNPYPFQRIGTASYRPPEIFAPYEKEKERKNKKSSETFQNHDLLKIDIFSIAVVMLICITGKHFLTFIEEKHNPQNLYFKYIKKNKIQRFWKEVEKKSKEISSAFKELFIKMVNFVPSKRPTIDEILKDPWFQEIKVLDENTIIKLKNEIKEDILNLSP